MFKTVTAELLARLTHEAKKSERKRAHYTLHIEMTDPVHRFPVVAEPETVVNFLRHPGKREMLVILRGEIEVISRDENRTRTRALHVAPPTMTVRSWRFPKRYFTASSPKKAPRFWR